MNYFRLSTEPIDPSAEKAALGDPAAGACVCFEGWVRNHQHGRTVTRLDYQAFVELAEREGAAILAEAATRHALRALRCVHRVGTLVPGDLAVWAGASADHRDAAFAACGWLIDDIKRRVPIWKKEHYVDGESGWLHPDET
jgi:molybdopterin synthase catalytic subunit